MNEMRNGTVVVTKKKAAVQCILIWLAALGIQVAVAVVIGLIASFSIIEEAKSTAAMLSPDFIERYSQVITDKLMENSGIVALLTTIVSTVVAIVWYYRKYMKERAKQMVSGAVSKVRSVNTVIAVVLMALGTHYVMIIAAQFAEFVLPQSSIDGYEEVIRLAGVDSVFGMLLAVFVAPINEELFFRGLVYRKMREAWSVRASIIVAGVLFALLHLIPYQVIYALPAGILLSWIMSRYDSVLPGILTHILVNAYSFVGDRIDPMITEKIGIPGGMAVFAVVAIVALSAGVYKIKRITA